MSFPFSMAVHDDRLWGFLEGSIEHVCSSQVNKTVPFTPNFTGHHGRYDLQASKSLHWAHLPKWVAHVLTKAGSLFLAFSFTEH